MRSSGSFNFYHLFLPVHHRLFLFLLVLHHLFLLVLHHLRLFHQTGSLPFYYFCQLIASWIHSTPQYLPVHHLILFLVSYLLNKVLKCNYFVLASINQRYLVRSNGITNWDHYKLFNCPLMITDFWYIILKLYIFQIF